MFAELYDVYPFCNEYRCNRLVGDRVELEAKRGFWPLLRSSLVFEDETTLSRRPSLCGRLVKKNKGDNPRSVVHEIREYVGCNPPVKEG